MEILMLGGARSMRTAQSWPYHVQAPLKKTINTDEGKSDGPRVGAGEAHVPVKIMYTE